MSQPVTARWYMVQYPHAPPKDVHDREKALEYVDEGFDVKVVSNSSPDPKGRRVHGYLQPDGTVADTPP